ncbi:MAG: hypothetical protein ACLQBX_03615 [Candidatus Limnocylindrales bacterium]
MAVASVEDRVLDALAADDPRQGTRSGYNNGCRCDACKQANSEYNHERRKPSVARVVVATPAPRPPAPAKRSLHDTRSPSKRLRDAAIAAGTVHVVAFTNFSLPLPVGSGGEALIVECSCGWIGEGNIAVAFKKHRLSLGLRSGEFW